MNNLETVRKLLLWRATVAKGIGAKLGKLFGRLLRGDETQPARLVDVLFHLPYQVIDRRFRCTISRLPAQGIATLKVTIGKHKPPPRGTRLPYKIECFDDTGHMNLVFFSAYADHLARQITSRRFGLGLEQRLLRPEVEEGHRLAFTHAAIGEMRGDAEAMDRRHRRPHLQPCRVGAEVLVAAHRHGNSVVMLADRKLDQVQGASQLVQLKAGEPFEQRHFSQDFDVHQG